MKKSMKSLEGKAGVIVSDKVAEDTNTGLSKSVLDKLNKETMELLDTESEKLIVLSEKWGSQNNIALRKYESWLDEIQDGKRFPDDAISLKDFQYLVASLITRKDYFTQVCAYLKVAIRFTEDLLLHCIDENDETIADNILYGVAVMLIISLKMGIDAEEYQIFINSINPDMYQRMQNRLNREKI
jgi:hypothetical protein